MPVSFSHDQEGRSVNPWTANTLNGYKVKYAKFYVYILCLTTGICNHSFFYIVVDVSVSRFHTCFRSFYQV